MNAQELPALLDEALDALSPDKYIPVVLKRFSDFESVIADEITGLFYSAAAIGQIGDHIQEVSNQIEAEIYELLRLSIRAVFGELKALEVLFHRLSAVPEFAPVVEPVYKQVSDFTDSYEAFLQTHGKPEVRRMVNFGAQLCRSLTDLRLAFSTVKAALKVLHPGGEERLSPKILALPHSAVVAPEAPEATSAPPSISPVPPVAAEDGGSPTAASAPAEPIAPVADKGEDKSDPLPEEGDSAPRVAQAGNR